MRIIILTILSSLSLNVFADTLYMNGMVITTGKVIEHRNCWLDHNWTEFNNENGYFIDISNCLKIGNCIVMQTK